MLPHEILETILTKLEKIEKRLVTLPEDYLTIDEVCKKMRITRPTLWAHTKRGNIPSYRIGGKVLYKYSEVENILKQVLT
jgi:excisionase family DNA binding protein